MFGFNILYVWMIIIIAGVAIEAFTLNLSAIWFAVGGVAALAAGSIGFDIVVQLVVFVLFSAILLALMRPFCQRFLRTKKEPTNADRIIGSRAVVIEDIDNSQQTGEIKVFGQMWTARSTDHTVFSKGDFVRVVEIQGVKAIVEKA